MGVLAGSIVSPSETLIVTWSNTRRFLPSNDPRERPHPHARPAGAHAARAGDRRRARRRRRRGARDGARLARGDRPRRARRRPRLHRFARAFPYMGARPERGQPRRVRERRRGARADQSVDVQPGVGFAATAGAAATGSRSAIRPVRNSMRSPPIRRPGWSPRITTRSGSTRRRSRSRTGISRSRAASSSGMRAASRPGSCARRPPGVSRSGT